MLEEIRVKGAAQHNLKHIDVSLPRNKLIVVTGPSGSGKSSLAFDTIFAEGQRRYIECLSAYARQFIDQMEKPEVESVEGISPSISIDQKTISTNPRSTASAKCIVSSPGGCSTGTSASTAITCPRSCCSPWTPSSK